MPDTSACIALSEPLSGSNYRTGKVMPEENSEKQELGNWMPHPDGRYAGKIDRVQVALGEPWAVGYFIDHWLAERGAPVDNANRDKVAAVLESYTGSAPYAREVLDAYLDILFKTGRVPGTRS